MCLNNTLTVHSSTVPVSQITLNTDNGTIKREQTGIFTIYPATGDSANIFIFRKVDNGINIIGKTTIGVQRVPMSDFEICGRSKGYLPKSCLETHEGIAVFFDLPDIKRYFAIFHYIVIIERDGREIYKKDIAGFNFDDSTKNVIKSLENGDVLKIQDLGIVDCDDMIHELGNYEFVITDAY